MSLHHNFKLLLTQIFCRRLNLEQGTVSLEVGLSYDLLRFIPCSTICSHPFQGLLHWGVSLFVVLSLEAFIQRLLKTLIIFLFFFNLLSVDYTGLLIVKISTYYYRCTDAVDMLLKYIDTLQKRGSIIINIILRSCVIGDLNLSMKLNE